MSDFVIKDDQAEDFGGSRPNGHYIALVFSCHHCHLEVSAYGDDREAALKKAARELRHLVISHQSRCDVCDANILYNLLGVNGLEPGRKGDPE